MPDKNDKEIEEILEDLKYVPENWGNFLEAYPHETNQITSHVLTQVKEYMKNFGIEKKEADRGYEHIVILDRRGMLVRKRIIHETGLETITGADIIITKEINRKIIRFAAIQVKRNKRESFFEFTDREIKQFKRFEEHFPHGYYLFINEKNNPPTECFVRVKEIRDIFIKINAGNSARISNSEIEKYCRGYHLFYDTFYGVGRGTKSSPTKFIEIVSKYVKSTTRIIVELSANIKNKN